MFSLKIRRKHYIDEISYLWTVFEIKYHLGHESLWWVVPPHFYRTQTSCFQIICLNYFSFLCAHKSVKIFIGVDNFKVGHIVLKLHQLVLNWTWKICQTLPKNCDGRQKMKSFPSGTFIFLATFLLIKGIWERVRDFWCGHIRSGHQ